MEANSYICATCGVQFAAGANKPEHCAICEDERQYVGWSGQRWTTLDELRNGHRNQLRDDLGLLGIGTEPSFAIGQRAILVRTPQGNLLWDCITLIDDATIDAVQKVGGIRAIAISHPHYYSAMVEWAERLDARVLLHEADREHVMRPDARVEHWPGERLDLGDGLELHRLGGHFEGGTVCLWRDGAGGRGALLSGDIVQVVADRDRVSFMYSYPNLIPLPAETIRRIVAGLEPYDFDRIYGAWWDAVVRSDGKAAVGRSAERYLRAIGAV